MIDIVRSIVRRARRDERGFVVIFLTVLLVTLLALAGFAVDFWHWNHEGSRMQKAADAAALGGAVFMPENPGGVAFATAQDRRAATGSRTKTTTSSSDQEGRAAQPARRHDREDGRRTLRGLVGVAAPPS